MLLVSCGRSYPGGYVNAIPIKRIPMSVLNGCNGGMDYIKRNRRANVLRLIAERYRGNKAAFAREINRPPPNVHRMLGEGEGDRRGIGEDLARDIENKLGLAPGWLDRGQGEENALEPGPDLPSPHRWKRIPVVGTAQLGPDGFWCETGYPVGIGDGYVEFFSDDPNAYALRVRGESMAPAIRSGWLVLIEPNRSYVAGDYVMVCTVEGQCMVKEFLYERDGEFAFASINESYGRITLLRNGIEKIHPVVGVFAPSKFKPW